MVERLDDQLSCPICIEICIDAVETGCCGQLLCANCTVGLRACPCCRAEPLSTSINRSIRRMIGAMPVECKCGFKTTRSELPSHDLSCPMKILTCSVPNCRFEGTAGSFLTHITENHRKEVIAYFTTHETPTTSGPAPPTRDCIGAKGRARIGSNGKYYCGSRLNGSCGCCDGNCGPTNGCNCVNCMKLDIEARALPAGYLVNREGRIARKGDAGMWYCGAMVMQGVSNCDGYCGPTNGPQCSACARLQSQLGSRYAAIVSSWGRR